ncbi:MAG: hypothetical protein M1816_001774 [Peltula sp. TS41687]|nr:MAG: hypothetical protein M1816_001774 [Peltula sp. TS41687]
MPSHHASPTKLPSSPLSCIFQPSPKPFIGRAKALSSDHLRLSTEMRFHQSSPLKSLDGSSSATPKERRGLEMAATTMVPKTPPRPHHKHSYSEAQRQLDLLRREFVLNTSRLKMSTTTPSLSSMASTVVVTSYHQSQYPVSPRLLPMRSPGPVTPLILEADEGSGYFVPDSRIPEYDLLGEMGQTQLKERLLREETKLRESRGSSP